MNDDDVARLVANHREFLRFVERRVGSRALAEEIVQDAFVHSLDGDAEIRESVVGWFYRVLRNAVIDIASGDRRWPTGGWTSSRRSWKRPPRAPRSWPRWPAAASPGWPRR